MICDKLGECLDRQILKQPMESCANNNVECIEVSDNRPYVKCEEKGKKYIHFPLNEIDHGNIDSFFLDRGYDEDYFKGLISEHLVQKTRNGATVFVWEKISKDAWNEPLDLKVYNLACMQSLNLNFESLYEAFNSNSLT